MKQQYNEIKLVAQQCIKLIYVHYIVNSCEQLVTSGVKNKKQNNDSYLQENKEL